MDYVSPFFPQINRNNLKVSLDGQFWMKFLFQSIIIFRVRARCKSKSQVLTSNAFNAF